MKERKRSEVLPGLPEHNDIVAPTKTVRVINKLALAALAVIGIGIAIILYWLYQPSSILSVNNEPFPTEVIGDFPRSDGVIILTTDFCKKLNIEGELRMSFISSTRESFLPIRKERSPVGCRVVQFPVIIPKEIESGEYKVKFYVTYNVNPLKKNVRDEFLSEAFIIDKNGNTDTTQTTDVKIDVNKLNTN